ncbi:MAG: peptidoglycan DD-metalloendopeptidase family protein [Rhodospirillaceae bacterium]|nr:peptidoglycan DD-metalloendopeptidase family protein [Rhodospirillaceae bacterium]MBT4701035.1 peptidoglycan DD-metalloendopeptidase family protein [Rhodospirillaceae bacterium]MBT6221507.1 peptidoglycan DD-metalloendopeptidase family protein [Rhodospirillaceae bacterium]MBT6363338.1 peptidoglycan DD-metalloendopeptidase family protein [Rhodospirillaceae bacterium]
MTHLHRIKICACLIGALLWGAAASAQAKEATPDKQLNDVQRALKKSLKEDRRLRREAALLAQELVKFRRESITQAKAIQDHEQRVTWLEAKLTDLNRQQLEKKEKLKRQRRQFASVLIALQRLANNPPEALIAQPIAPGDMVRSAILLRAAVPKLETHASRLRHDLATLNTAREETLARRVELESASTELRHERANLKRLLLDTTRLKNQISTRSNRASRRVKSLTKKEKSLQGLMARLTRERKLRAEKDNLRRKKIKLKAPKPAAKNSILKKPQKTAKPPQGGTPEKPFSQARGRLPLPAVGRLVGLYGQAKKSGLTRKGITIRTRPGAQVVAPYGGTVVFSGPFRRYGQLLIIEHSEGYHSLLAGMVRIDSKTGNKVFAGEPVGSMGGANDGVPSLYLELRRNGQPINPLPWLAARKGKANG